MNGLLVRVGADQTSGGGKWNGPCDADSGAFCYVPIPETKTTRDGLATPYQRISGAVSPFSQSLPLHLADLSMHLDPDFEHLTYGDRGPKGKQLSRTLQRDDLLVFYAGLRDTSTRNLVYAIIGLFVVDRLVNAREQPAIMAHRNAHTRRALSPEADDVIVIAQQAASGRLEKCIPIGEYRSKAYRVREDLLSVWGGISANDGYLQRSAVFPALRSPHQFLLWWKQQRPQLINDNGF
jgi:hypothetical protein